MEGMEPLLTLPALLALLFPMSVGAFLRLAAGAVPPQQVEHTMPPRTKLPVMVMLVWMGWVAIRLAPPAYTLIAGEAMPGW